MRNRLAWMAGALGAAGVAYRALRKQPAAETAADPRADELRRKLDESKPLVAEREEFEAGETPVDASDSLADKRAAVHERGRAAADEMRGPTAGE
jgi:thiamine monophosphate kinase